MIKEVIFDIDDTLYDYEKGHAAGVRQMQEYAEQELGVSGEEFEREYRRQHADIKKRLGTDDATIHSRSIRIQNMLEHWGKASCGERAGAGQHRGGAEPAGNGNTRGHRQRYDLPDAV